MVATSAASKKLNLKKTVAPILFYFGFFSQYTNRKTASSQNISNYSKKIENEK
jgi:hypothetical protein